MSDKPTNRGRPISVAVRERIRKLRVVEGLPVRVVARQVGVSLETVVKYGGK